MGMFLSRREVGLDPNAGESSGIIKQKGFNSRKLGHRQGNTQRQRVMLRQSLDTKRETKYIETNKTQVDTIKLTKTQRDTGEDNETGKH